MRQKASGRPRRGSRAGPGRLSPGRERERADRTLSAPRCTYAAVRWRSRESGRGSGSAQDVFPQSRLRLLQERTLEQKWDPGGCKEKREVATRVNPQVNAAELPRIL